MADGKKVIYCSTSSQKRFNNPKSSKVIFMKPYVERFNADNLSESLSLEAFDKEDLYYEYFNKQKKHLLEKIKSNSSLRKVFDSYLDIVNNNDNEELQNVKIQIWFAKIWYQEKRKLLPDGFLEFLSKVYDNLDKDNEKFKDFLEVFVAYHKYFNPKSK